MGDGLSASQIARALASGATRNAAIGKARRFSFSGRWPHGKPSAQRKSAGVSVAGMSGEPHWPDFACGRAVRQGSYCEPQRAIAHRAAPRRARGDHLLKLAGLV